MFGSPPRRAFTLIELLVVSAILGIVVFVIAAAVAAGVRVWDAARSCGELEAEALFGLAVTERDLANAVPFADIPFVGDRARVSFAGLSAGGGGPPALCAVEYAFDPGRRAWARRQWPYPDGNRETARPEDLVRDVAAVRLSYIEAFGGGRAGVRKETWTDPTGFPARVEVELTLERRGERAGYERTVFIPVTGK